MPCIIPQDAGACEAREIGTRLKTIIPAVVPSVVPFRNPEHCELFSLTKRPTGSGKGNQAFNALGSNGIET